MITRLILLAMLALTCATAKAQPLDDSKAYHLVVVTLPSPTQFGRELLNSLDTHPRLQAITKQCKTFRWTTATPIYRERYAASLPPTELPIVALVRSDGGVIWKSSGPVVMGDALADALVARAFADRSANQRLVPPTNQQSQSQTRPNFLRRPLDDVIPDTITIDHQHAASGIPWREIGFAAVGLIFIGCLSLLALVILVVLIGLAVKS